MKFNHVQAFEKHLETAAQDHLSSVYLIVDPEDYSQKKLAQKICQKDEDWQPYEAEQLSVAELDNILNTSSMFVAKECLGIIGIDKLPKKALGMLIDYAKKPHPAKRLAMSASTMSKDFMPFVKSGVVLDLSLEKPWERDKRLSQEAMERFRKYNLRATAQVCDQFVKLCGSQSAMMDQEVEKMALFLYGKHEVTIQDLEFVLASPQLSIFKVTQALFDRQFKEALSLISQQKFPLVLLIYSLRSAVQRSFRLQSLPQSEYAQQMPQVKGYLLEKSLKLAAEYSKAQFIKMLQVLFSIELLMKSQPLSEEYLMSLLILQMRGLTHESH